MNESSFHNALADLPLGGTRFFTRIGSTNDAALAWAADGAPDMTLIYAEEQTAGRGRGSHKWFTPPGAALAFSLILRPLPSEQQSILLFSALGALAVSQVLEGLGLFPEIKWPNDVLLSRSKICGILAESVWIGAQVDSIVMGIGININPASVPPPDLLDFPATCLEAEVALQGPHNMRGTFDRPVLLQQILQAIIQWREKLETDAFFQAWENRLAFLGDKVEIWGEGQEVRAGQLDGLERDGSLRLRSPRGDVFTIQFGEVHLRLVV